MKFLLHLAALQFLALGIGHSYLGERFVLAPIFRNPDLPKLFGSGQYMRRILRLAWHVTSVAWFGLAGIVVLLAHPPVDPRAISVAIGITALVSFALVMIFTRGRHVAAWVAFLVIAAITLPYGAGI